MVIKSSKLLILVELTFFNNIFNFLNFSSHLNVLFYFFWTKSIETKHKFHNFNKFYITELTLYHWILRYYLIDGFCNHKLILGFFSFLFSFFFAWTWLRLIWLYLFGNSPIAEGHKTEQSKKSIAQLNDSLGITVPKVVTGTARV